MQFYFVAIISEYHISFLSTLRVDFLFCTILQYEQGDEQKEVFLLITPLLFTKLYWKFPHNKKAYIIDSFSLLTSMTFGMSDRTSAWSAYHLFFPRMLHTIQILSTASKACHHPKLHLMNPIKSHLSKALQGEQIVIALLQWMTMFHVIKFHI